MYDGIGKALRCRASAPMQSISRAMRPSMESFPGETLCALCALRHSVLRAFSLTTSCKACT